MLGKRKAAPLLALALAAVVGCGSAWTLSSEASVQATQAAERLETAYDGVESGVARGDALLRSTTTADVADAGTLSNLDMALHQAHAALDEGVRDSGGTSIFDWASMSADARHNQETADSVAAASTLVTDAIKAVQDSIDLQDSIEARATLESLLEEAKAAYEEAEGGVSDATTLTALSDTIGSVEAALAGDVSATDASVYQAAADSLSTAQAAAQSGGSVAQAADGTWYVNYATGQYVDSSGGVTEYFDNYYVAHRSTGTNGQTIASRPTYVVVDGVRYRYVSERHAAVGSDYNLIKEWATANGGIAFQTCEPDGSVLVTHYEPIG